jgi:wyosine [tRNA(Phe)-imidazoG37] synthetase (radical SAM superfamily)
MIVFGPIPSRRLGRSLGINNIPPKVCSYSCVYCQVGITDSMSVHRRNFFPPEEIFNEVKDRVSQLHKAGEKIDYFSFVPDGEPTLDINLGSTIEKLKTFNIKIAVITNSSLLWDDTVKRDLMHADWICIKIDTVNSRIWHRINRPHNQLDFSNIIKGIEEFASSYKGILCTETMLIREVNDNRQSINETAQLISRVNPAKAFILTPVRPPAENWVKAPDKDDLNTAGMIFNSYGIKAELLASSEEVNFTYSSNVENELLSIIAVHPMKEDAIKEFLSKANSNWDLIEQLIENKKIKKIDYSGSSFFVKYERKEVIK